MTYDQWKLASPDDYAGSPWFPNICEECGSNYEDDSGPEWRSDGEHMEPFGWCNKCGWRCEPCSDIQDAFERSAP